MRCTFPGFEYDTGPVHTEEAFRDEAATPNTSQVAPGTVGSL